MKRARIAVAIGLVVGGVLALRPVPVQAAPTPTPVPLPGIANQYSTWMARAMDQCNPATVSVLGTLASPLPALGCHAANVVTDSTMEMTGFARLVVGSRTGRLLLYGRGFKFGSRVKVQLTARVTKPGQTTHHPLRTGQNVTFTDVTILCPSASFGFPVGASGSLLGNVKLSDCLSGNSLPIGLAAGNIEILDAELVNVDTGKVFARPGLER